MRVRFGVTERMLMVCGKRALREVWESKSVQVTGDSTVRSGRRCALMHKQICKKCLPVKLNRFRPV